MKMLMNRSARRKLQTIISRKIIKPSSSTPSNLQTYNLTELDQLAIKAYTPLVLFYPNTSLNSQHKCCSRVLQTALSQTLAKYYPFAGRMKTPETPFVDCNDAGVVFLEAKNDSPLEAFLRLTELDEKVDQLFANDLVCYESPRNTSLLGVQVNHFECGGIGVAVTLSHVLADANSLGNFITHWAAVARYGSTDHSQVLPLNPHIIRSPPTKSVGNESQLLDMNQTRPVSRKFVFPDTKLLNLKKKVELYNLNINPTRVELLTSLIYKTAVAAATTKTGCFRPSYLFFMVNIRNKLVEKLPQTTMGNFVEYMMVPSLNASDTSLPKMVSEIRKQKLKLEGIHVQQVNENFKSILGDVDLKKISDGSYFCSSICGLPYKEFDFGWGKPVSTTLPLRWSEQKGFLLKDTVDGNGIEAIVVLEEEDMEIFENDKELLSFCKIK